MLIGCVIQYQINDDTNTASVCFGEESFEIVHRAVVGIDRVIIGDIIAVIRRRRVNRHQPDSGDAEIGMCVWISIIQIIQLLR